MSRTLCLSIVGLMLLGGILLAPPHAHAGGTRAYEQDPVAYWSFDEGSGNVAGDSSGNNHTGTVNGSAWTSGISDHALDFDGVDDNVMIAASTSLDNMNALTYSAWIYPRVDAHWHVLDKGDGDRRLYAEGTNLSFSGRVRYSGAHAYAESANGTVRLGEWQHVLMTWNATDGKLRLYYNGVEAGYSMQTTGTGSTSDDSSDPFYIGARGGVGAGTVFDGVIDEVYIWNRTLSAAEVHEHYIALALPGAPQGVLASAGDSGVTLQWQAPSFSGASAVANYSIYRGTAPGSLSLLTSVGSVLTFTDTGLTNGQRYYYGVAAVNSHGEGAQSEEVNATPMAVPSAPASLSIRAGNGYVNLTWEQPSSEGGTPVTGYVVYRGTASDGLAQLATVGDVRHYNDTAVTNAQRYHYAVSALNLVGEGALSAEVNATPYTVPGAPYALHVRGGDSYLNVTWSAPSDDGGSPVAGYAVYRGTSIGTGTKLSTLGNVLYYNDTTVTNGQRYYYTIAALNAAGEGSASAEASGTPSSGSADDGTPWLADDSLCALGLIALAAATVAAVLLWLRGRGAPGPGGAEDRFEIDLGRNHLFLTEDVDETFRTFKGIVEGGSPGLILTNRFPDNVRQDFGIEGTRIIWFSDTASGDDIFRPQRLDFEVSKETINFIRDNKEPVILMDGLDYLVLINNFESVSRFLKKITDVASMAHATLVVIVRPEALSPEKVSYLRGQFDRVV